MLITNLLRYIRHITTCFVKYEALKVLNNIFWRNGRRQIDIAMLRYRRKK